MNDLRDTIIPKSDQLNSDDLIGGPRTIRITKVSRNAGEQPVNVHFDGDGGKPFRPCKSMRRVMVQAWGPNADAYAGRSMTLYRDEAVTFGGMAVGGIRISHLSDIPKKMTMALTATKGKRAPYVVEPLKAETATAGGPDKATGVAQDLIKRAQGCYDSDALQQLTSDETVVKQRAWLKEKRPELAAKVDEAVATALAAIDAPATDTAGDGPL